MSADVRMLWRCWGRCTSPEMSCRILSHTQTHTHFISPPSPAVFTQVWPVIQGLSWTFKMLPNNITLKQQRYSWNLGLITATCLVDYQTFSPSAVMCHQSVTQSKWWPNDNLIKSKNAGRVLLIIITNSSTKQYSGVLNNLMFTNDRWLQLVQLSFHSWSKFRVKLQTSDHE